MACKVSVCIPTYNYGNFIAEAIESVLAQDFEDFELLIIDDNSSDDTRSVVEPFVARDPRLRFLVNQQNVGMVQNWNLCLEKAQGEYLKFLFGDDLLSSPDALSRMVRVLDESPAVSLVASARKLVDERSEVTGVVSRFPGDCLMNGTDAINHCLFRQKNLIGEPSVVMFRRAQGARGFKTNYRQIVDLEMWFHLLEQGSFAYLADPLCAFRVHGRQQTAVNREKLSDFGDVFHLLDDYLGKGYVRLPRFMKKYLMYDHLYGIWKQSRRNPEARSAVTGMISERCGLSRFRTLRPIYKVFKPCLKAYRKLVPIQ